MSAYLVLVRVQAQRRQSLGLGEGRLEVERRVEADLVRDGRLDELVHGAEAGLCWESEASERGGAAQ